MGYCGEKRGQMAAYDRWLIETYSVGRWGGGSSIFYITSLFYIRTQTLPLENGSGGWGEGDLGPEHMLKSECV